MLFVDTMIVSKLELRISIGGGGKINWNKNNFSSNSKSIIKNINLIPHVEGICVSTTSRSLTSKSGTISSLITQLFSGVITDVAGSIIKTLGKNALRPTAVLNTLAASTEVLTLDKKYNRNDDETQRIKGFMSSAVIARKQVSCNGSCCCFMLFLLICYFIRPYFIRYNFIQG
jgi:hypothetical protein